MSDIKEETSVHNAEQQPAGEAVEQKHRTGEPGLDNLQVFYEKNKKAVNYVGGGLLVIIAAFVYFKFFYMPEQEKEAANEIFWAQDLFEKDSFNLALRGGLMVNSPDGQKQMMGFEQVASEYDITRTGKLANYYAGICYLRTGKFEQAIEWLSKYHGSDDFVAPLALGAIGDCNMELNRLDEAVKYYMKAAEESDNTFTCPYFLKKASMAFELSGNFRESLKMLERIQHEYAKSTEADDVERHMARVRAAGNL
jgi:tetratricopeptide (TPR) repeat protein